MKRKNTTQEDYQYLAGLFVLTLIIADAFLVIIGQWQVSLILTLGFVMGVLAMKTLELGDKALDSSE